MEYVSSLSANSQREHGVGSFDSTLSDWGVSKASHVGGYCWDGLSDVEALPVKQDENVELKSQYGADEGVECVSL